MTPKFECPICGSVVKRSGEDFPFCSERCRLIDLGRWSDGSYAIPAEPANLDNELDERLH